MYARVVDEASAKVNTDSFLLSGMFLTEFRRSVKVAKDSFLLLKRISAVIVETVAAFCRVCFI